MNKLVTQEELTLKELQVIRTELPCIGSGSEVTCYRLSYRKVIKLFEIACGDPASKLYLPHSEYGNNTYFFVDAIKKYHDKIIGYTMPYVKGKELRPEIIDIIPFETLLIFFQKVNVDTLDISKKGILTYDNFISNILVSTEGFKSIDSIDFIESDKVDYILYKENLLLFYRNFWDFLFTSSLRSFCNNSQLPESFLYEKPIDFFKELKRQVEEISEDEVRTIKDIKRLVRKKKSLH